MNKNDSHIVVHHYFDNISELKLITMACCIALSIVVVLIVLILLLSVVYIINRRLKRNKPILATETPHSLCGTLQNAHRAVSNSYKPEISSRRSTNTPASVFQDDSNPNAQNIPMSTFKAEADGSRADSSNSSGLCEVLFPPRHDGEVIYEPPPKLMTFAGKVYSTSRKDSGVIPYLEPQAAGSTTGSRNSNSMNASLEWDYFESRRYGASNASEIPEVDRKNVDVCWV